MADTRQKSVGGGRHQRIKAATRNPSQSGGPAVVGPSVAAASSEFAPPSLFDFFYEEFLTQLMSDDELADAVPEEFMRHTTDIDRVEYVMNLRPFVQEFEITGKIAVKALEKSNRYREEGNRLFQAEQTTQSVLFYNKALAYAPHPDYEASQRPEPVVPTPAPPVPPSGASSSSEESASNPRLQTKRTPSKYEALSFCYANRSAALRKLGQYEDCLKDISRAAKYGYPRENFFKLWERKAKCYQGMRRPEMAIKCYRQAIQSLKESTLSDNQKTLKSHEIQSWIRDIRLSAHSHPSAFVTATDEEGEKVPPLPDIPMMGATGPIVIVPDPVPKQRKASAMTLPPPELTPKPAKPERLSFRRKKTVKGEKAPPPPSPSPSTQPTPNGGGGGGGGGGSPETTSLGGSVATSVETTMGGGSRGTSLSRSSSMRVSSMPAPSSPLPPAAIGDLHKANSLMSISQMSGSGIKPDIEVPELSYGANPRMPSASCAVDVRFSADRGRHFVAVQDLNPGE